MLYLSPFNYSGTIAFIFPFHYFHILSVPPNMITFLNMWLFPKAMLISQFLIYISLAFLGIHAGTFTSAPDHHRMIWHPHIKALPISTHVITPQSIIISIICRLYTSFVWHFMAIFPQLGLQKLLFSFLLQWLLISLTHHTILTVASHPCCCSGKVRTITVW